MEKLRVIRLAEDAKLPTVAHPGEDLGYDVYALEDVVLPLNETIRVRTGVALQATGAVFVHGIGEGRGLIVKDRSSMADKGITTHGGVIDAGYTGEIVIFMRNNNPRHHYEHTANGYQGTQYTVSSRGYKIHAGDKIAQLVPVPVLTGQIEEVSELGTTDRGDKGFGSSGRA